MVVPTEICEVPVVRVPGRSLGRHAAVGVEVDVLDLCVLRHCAESLLLHIELDLRHLGNPERSILRT